MPPGNYSPKSPCYGYKKNQCDHYQLPHCVFDRHSWQWLVSAPRSLTVELTRARASDNFESIKLLEKHAIAPRVQRFVRRVAPIIGPGVIVRGRFISPSRSSARPC